MLFCLVCTAQSLDTTPRGSYSVLALHFPPTLHFFAHYYNVFLFSQPGADALLA
jgi:hypothetical protein